MWLQEHFKVLFYCQGAQVIPPQGHKLLNATRGVHHPAVQGSASGGRGSAAGYVIRAQAQSHLVLPEHISLGDAVQQGVGNLAGSASHHNTDWFGLDGHKQV